MLPVNTASLTSSGVSSTCAATQTVTAGETCYSIYTAAGLSADEFAQLNPGLNCDLLQASTTCGLLSTLQRNVLKGTIRGAWGCMAYLWSNPEEAAHVFVQWGFWSMHGRYRSQPIISPNMKQINRMVNTQVLTIKDGQKRTADCLHYAYLWPVALQM